MSAVAEQKGFYGWWISIAAFFTFGLAVGIPYYGMGFYYDYYQKAFGWTRPEMTLGFPLAVVLTLWVGPVIMHRYSPRILMMIGAVLTALAFIGFSTMSGNLMFYYGMWTLYTVGYILSGPIAHQIIISQWFKRHRGKAMAATYLGVGVFGGLVVKFFAAPITQATNFQDALFWTGIAVLLVIPIAFFVLKDKPSDIGQTPDGLPVAAHEIPPPSRTISDLMRQPAFWLLMVGSLCSIGAIGSINFHMKLVFKDQGFTDQKTLDTIFGNANLCILFSSIGGRIAMGYLADRFSKKYVMVTTYFLVAATIPLLFLVRPETPEYVYLFAVLFGFGMGADYMLIPLMAAEQFGVNTLARAMAIILPADTIGQTWFPYLVSQIRESAGSYGVALNIVFAMAALGAAAVFMLPSHGKKMKHFSYKNLDQLKQDAEQRTQFVRFETDKEKLKQLLGRKVPVGKSITLGNSMAIHPMEGCDSDLDGNPDELTWRRYERFAAGGAKLIWFEATAVRKDGRANARQLWLHEGNVDAYAKLLSRMLEIHKERFGTTDDLLIPIQLTHSGRYSYPNRIIAYHNPLIDAKTNTPASQAPISDEELEELEDVYLAGAKLAWKAGFRAIDLKVTHGYLLAELMGAKTREGRYGGSLENRTRFIRNVIEKVKAEFGDEMLIAMRLGCFDSVPYRKNDTTTLGEPLPYEIPYPYGWGVNPEDPLSEDLTEVKQAIGWFKDWGVKLLNVSIGCPYYNPHIGRPFEKPDEGNYEMPEHPLLGVDRHFRISGELQQAFPDLPMVGTGYSWLQIYSLNAAAHNIEQGRIQIFGIGRNALSYPDFAVDALEKGVLDEIRVCKTLTYCTFLMRQKNHPLGQFPAGCPPFDKLVYGPIMKQAREAFRSQK